MMLKRPITATSAAGARRRAAAARPITTTNTISSSRSNARRRTATTTATPTNAASSAAETPTKTLLALKEWAVTIDALLSGDQVLLLRKGGLLDGKGNFKLEARDFLLFPTVFHVDSPSLLAPGAAEKFAAALALPEPKTLSGSVPLRCRASVEAAWSVTDGRVVEALANPPGLHVWGEAFTEARLKWRPGAPMTLALVRAHARRENGGVLAVKQRPDYYGCFSWARVEPVTEEEEGEEGLWRPVLSDEVFSQRAALVREGLAAAGIDATPLEL